MTDFPLAPILSLVPIAGGNLGGTSPLEPSRLPICFTSCGPKGSRVKRLKKTAQTLSFEIVSQSHTAESVSRESAKSGS